MQVAALNFLKIHKIPYKKHNRPAKGRTDKTVFISHHLPGPRAQRERPCSAASEQP